MLKTCLFIVSPLLAGNLYGKPVTIDDADLHKILRELHEIRVQLNHIQNTLDNSYTNQDRHEPNENYTIWGCYMNDINAGGIYGTGLTEAEARGVALEKCSSKNGACFDIFLKCSKTK